MSEAAMSYSRSIRPECAYYARCKEFFESLDISDRGITFDAEFDMCYCQQCHTWRGDVEVYTRGTPPKKYGLPIGWVRFALREPVQATANKAAENWHRAFHGTPISCIQPILDVSRLVAVDRNPKTGKLDICPDEEKREDWHVILSPSIKYAGYYGDPEKIQLKDGRSYETRVAFYTLINRTSYKVKTGKIRDPRQQDTNFPLSQLEWFSDQKGGHLLYGLLVHME